MTKEELAARLYTEAADLLIESGNNKRRWAKARGFITDELDAKGREKNHDSVKAFHNDDKDEFEKRRRAMNNDTGMWGAKQSLDFSVNRISAKKKRERKEAADARRLREKSRRDAETKAKKAAEEADAKAKEAARAADMKGKKTAAIGVGVGGGLAAAAGLVLKNRKAIAANIAGKRDAKMIIKNSDIKTLEKHIAKLEELIADYEVQPASERNAQDSATYRKAKVILKRLRKTYKSMLKQKAVTESVLDFYDFD